MSNSDEKPILPPFGQIRDVRINMDNDRPCVHYLTKKDLYQLKKQKASSVCFHPDHVMDEVHEE